MPEKIWFIVTILFSDVCLCIIAYFFINGLQNNNKIAKSNAINIAKIPPLGKSNISKIVRYINIIKSLIRESIENIVFTPMLQIIKE